jgi:hypothetical protein
MSRYDPICPAGHEKVKLFLPKIIKSNGKRRQGGAAEKCRLGGER